MGVQSFKFPVDFLNNIEKPIIFIANKHKEILDSVSVYDNLSLTCNLNAFQTASFKIYRDVDSKKQDYFKLFEEEMLIMIPGISWYEIHVETNIEPTGVTKSITATSLECTLCNKRLVDFQVNSDDFEDDDYVITTFYNPTEPKKSLLNRVLNVSPIWTVGHVDQSLWNIQRTFDESDVDVYSFLTGTVSEAFNCLFTFDTFNNTVNAYDLDNYGVNTDIFVSMDNLAQNMTETIDENSIFTCYRITGGSDIQIAEVNPNGTNKIYNFEYYLPMMPIELQSKVKQYDAKYQELKPKYEDIVKRLGDQIYVIQELNTKYPDSLASKDWTLYGLSGLETYKKSFETQNELFCAQGMNKPASLNYNLYTQNLENLNAVTAEYNKRLSEINEATNVYQSIVSEMKSLQSELDMNVWFTEDEWKILDSYVIEQTYSNDNFGAVDNTTEAELFSMEKELYDKAWEDLSKKCRPQYQYSSTLSNILTIQEFKEFVPYFELGNFIQMETDYDTIVRLRLISFTVDYSNTQTIAVTFSDAIRVKEIYEDASSIQAQANSAAMSFQFNKDQYDKSVNESNFVAEMRKYGLDVATTQIHNSKNQSQVWDESGMTFRMWNDERQDFDPEQIKIINNMMVFTDSGFDDTKMAIGKISLSNGTTAYGINAEVFVGTAIFSQYFTAQNPSGTFKIDDDGLSATNGINTIKIQPNNSGELFSIYKGNSKQLYFTSDGDAVFSGSLKSASGTFSGLISGGSINLGNGVFTVDQNGNMYASSGTFSGDISGSSGTFGGVTIDSNGLSSNQFSIDAYGNASFSGTLSASSITSSGALNDYLTSSDLGASGTTSIDGGRIKTGTISADRIDVDNLVAKKGNFTKSFNVEIPISGSKNFVIRAQSDELCFIGREVYNSGLGGNVLYGIYFKGNKAYYAGNSVYGEIATKNDIPDMSNFAPASHTHSNYITKFSGDGKQGVYNSIYTSGQIIYGSKISYSDLKDKVSDIRMKNSISEIKDITSLYMDLKPVEYRYNKGVGYEDNLQFGVIAQWTQNELLNHGYNDCGLVRGSKPLIDTDEANYIDDDVVLRVDYSQFHALHMKMIQKHEQEIRSLKQEIKDIKERIK